MYREKNLLHTKQSYITNPVPSSPFLAFCDHFYNDIQCVAFCLSGFCFLKDRYLFLLCKSR